MEDRLVADLAQQLRGASASIVGCARTLEHCDDQLGTEQRAGFLQRICDDASRLGDLARNVLAVTRPAHPSAPCAPVTAVVQHVVPEASGRHERRRVRSHIPPDLRTRMDVDALHDVLLNLLTNGLRFAAPGSRVDVVARAGRGRVLIEVCNVGPLIPAADRVRVFEPFVAGVTEGDTRPGAGLGLYVVRTLVEAHGGAVEVTASEGATRFSVHLPGAVSGYDRHAGAVAPAEAQPTSGRMSSA